MYSHVRTQKSWRQPRGAKDRPGKPRRAPGTLESFRTQIQHVGLWEPRRHPNSPRGPSDVNVKQKKFWPPWRAGKSPSEPTIHQMQGNSMEHRGTQESLGEPREPWRPSNHESRASAPNTQLKSPASAKHQATAKNQGPSSEMQRPRALIQQ